MRHGLMPTWIVVLAALSAVACKKKQDEEASANMGMRGHVMNETYVDTMVLRAQEFNKQIVCNGRLRAKARSELTFLQQGVVAQVHVKEGMHVAKGTLIASLDKQQQMREVEKARHDLEKARVELTDRLIGMGYDADLKDVPAEVMRRAEVISGYYSADYQLQSAEKSLRECDLHAPFAGKVANLEARAHEKSEKVCTLIDDSQYEVEFSVLEAELGHVAQGMPVRVSPFVQDSITYEGRISEINPLVDDKGLVKVKAQLAGRGTALLDGMNVRIVVEEKLRNMFVVPKDAVVERDGYYVVFLLRDNRAVWTYVDVEQSNISSFAITGCRRKETTIQEGDIVITSGNLNLADGTEVQVSGD